MCGIAGFLVPGGCRSDEAGRIAEKMAGAIAHRGPDDAGVWVDGDAGIALAHRRLAILDLSPAGHQPMHSRSGRYVVVYNGEIYNHPELRREVESAAAGPVEWVGRSDTEVLLACIELWGAEAALPKFQGMFAFALWDRKERSLLLARDRMGEKPLYYGWQDGVFLFGSELKALKRHPSFAGVIDREAVALQLRHAAVPAPYSIYEGIRKLTPASFVALAGGRGGVPAGELPDSLPYWSLADVVLEGAGNPLPGGDEEALLHLEPLLRDAVLRQMQSDVPLGAFLSGGIDSSLVVALMQSQSARPVHTFTVGFGERGFDEAGHAAAVARHLGTDHAELFVTADDALDLVPRLPELYDEPFADVSQIPAVLIAAMTGRHVKVALSGDGGDELFGGYNRYLAAHAFFPNIERMPFALRGFAAGVLDALPESAMVRLGERLGRSELSLKVSKLAGLLRAGDAESYYGGLVAFPDTADIALHSAGTGCRRCRYFLPDEQLAPLHAMMACDASGYLPDDILVKVDRAAMASGLETRIPFLDHRVVELAWRLPLSMKIRSGRGKWLLRRMLARHVPPALFDRPKAGFAVPLDGWLRGPLRQWAGSLLDPVRLKREGYLSPEAVSKLWREHSLGRCNRSHELWAILMFQAWLEKERIG